LVQSLDVANRIMVAAPAPIPDWQIALVVIPLFLAFWSLFMAMISCIGGWHSLTTLFRREEAKFSIGGGTPVERYRWASLKMGPKCFPTNYGNCVTVSLGDDGLGLQVMPLLRPMHPPLLIPWSAIECCRLGKEFLVFDCASVHVSELANPLRIYGRAGRAVYECWSTHCNESN
jgi:hypothetical protein